jgi:Streptomyces sporulation and cell division protein, SsgA
MTETVTREIVLGEASHADRQPVSVLRLHWSSADPLAVVLLVTARPDHPSLLRGRWVILRDRMRRVLSGPVGEPPVAAGHVQLSAHGEHVTLMLRGTTLPCVVTVPAAPLRSFLAETEAIVPAGLERCTAALEAELSRMLDGC